MRSRTATVAFVLAVFVIVGGVYTATHNYRGITDTTLNSLQTRALVLHGDVDLNRYGLDVEKFQTSQDKLVVERDGRLYSKYGVGVSIVAAPIYAVTARTGTADKTAEAAVAIIFAAGAAAVFGLLLVKIFSTSIAVVSLAVFAFGTTAWPVASMAFFQQGPVLFFESLGLLALLGHRQRPGLAGAAFGMAAFVRPTAAIVLAMIGLFYLLRGWRRFGTFTAGAAVPILMLIVSNRWIWGSWVEGGYGNAGLIFGAPFGRAFGGLTIGWWRGILVYSPFLALGVVGWILAVVKPGDTERALAFIGIATLMTLLVYSKWADWGGGLNQFGYRLLLEIVPMLILLAAFALKRLSKLLPVAVVLAAVSVVTMTWGAAPRRDRFDEVFLATEIQQTSLWRAWANALEHLGSGLLRLSLVAAACGGLALIATWASRKELQHRPTEARAG